MVGDSYDEHAGALLISRLQLSYEKRDLLASDPAGRLVSETDVGS